MKLLRLKITDPKGFRSLQAGFEYHFRSDWELQEEQGFAPFVCTGPNGSGKSNLLEVLAAIFFQLEMRRIRRRFLPEELQTLSDEINPRAFELDYLIKVPPDYTTSNGTQWAEVAVRKNLGEPVMFQWVNQGDFETDVYEGFRAGYAEILLPEYVLGYSSGENEILSLPFFKMRFVQYDEYWQALEQQLPYPGRPESRLVYLDSGFSQAILLCNLLFQDADALTPFRDDVKIEELKEFRVIIRRSIEVMPEVAEAFWTGGFGEGGFGQGGFDSKNPAISFDLDTGRYSVNLIRLLEADKDSADNFDPVVTRLRRCATSYFVDDSTDTLYLDYYVNEATQQAFRDNFGNNPLELFQAFQVLLTLNLYTISDQLKSDLYQSGSLYVSETVPTLASDERIMRFKNFWVMKTDIDEPVLLKSFSDGEHQLLHTLGLCLLFKNTQSMFLLDEPETHFNPDWRANFVTRLQQSFDGDDGQEMLITTHAPFLISDSRAENVLVFNKANGVVSVNHPDYNTLGASINKITMATFDKRETIGLRAQGILDDFRNEFEQGKDKKQLIADINHKLGDSVEKMLLIKTILDSMDGQG